MKNLTDFRKTVETGVDPRQRWQSYFKIMVDMKTQFCHKIKMLL